MKKCLFVLVLFWVLFPKMTDAQTIDTSMDVGNGKALHFTIIQGKGAPILFESGAGNNGNIWKDITPLVAEVTGATTITYDRLGFGENSQSSPVGFGNEIKALETALQKLGFAHQNIMLVSHSMGGLYQSYYASRHPNEVKAAVFIDASTTCSWAASFKTLPDVAKDLTDMLDTVIKHPMPLHIPVLDIVAGEQPDDNGNPDTVNANIWFTCHRNFVSESPVRKALLAYGSGHYVFIENPPLVINAIVTQYATYLAPKQKAAILEKAYALALQMANESKKNEVKCGHSEEDLNTWGYSLLENNETAKAIEIFRLNVTLHPDSWNPYDSLAEAYLKAGNKEMAIKNYQKSLELNPKNENAIQVLAEIQNK